MLEVENRETGKEVVEFAINSIVEEAMKAEDQQLEDKFQEFCNIINLCYIDNSYKNRPAMPAGDGLSIKPAFYIFIRVSDKVFEVLDRNGRRIVMGTESTNIDKKVAFSIFRLFSIEELQKKFNDKNAKMVIEACGPFEIKDVLIYPECLSEEVEKVKKTFETLYEIKSAEAAKASAAVKIANEKMEAEKRMLQESVKETEVSDEQPETPESEEIDEKSAEGPSVI